MSGRTVNPVVYFVIFGALIGLTLLTVAIGQALIGAWHTPVGLAIAIAKTTLIILFFMHLIHAEHLTWAVVGAAVFMVLLLVAGTLADYISRPWLVS